MVASMLRISASFNTQPPEGGWATRRGETKNQKKFQHTAARRRLALCPRTIHQQRRFQHTAARRRLVIPHLKRMMCFFRFNTQPPEGGWFIYASHYNWACSFNTQPPEGGWLNKYVYPPSYMCFNTQPPEGGWVPKNN